MGTENYGNYYYCVKVKRELSEDGEIYLMADGLRSTSDGSLEFFRKDGLITLLISPSYWLAVYGASLIDGSAVAVEHWAGEIIEDSSDHSTPRNNKNGNGKITRDAVSKSIRYDILKRDNYRCKLCGSIASETTQLEIDHIIPVSKGGDNSFGNLQTLCNNCNRGKVDKAL
jgi:hypothetical protein